LARLPLAALALAVVLLPAAVVPAVGLCTTLAVRGRLLEAGFAVVFAGTGAGFAATGAAFAGTEDVGFLDGVCAGAAAAHTINATTADEIRPISGALILAGNSGREGTRWKWSAAMTGLSAGLRYPGFGKPRRQAKSVPYR